MTVKALGSAALLGAWLAACGEDPVPPKETPTPAEVRTFYGLNPGTCFRYKYPMGGNLLEGTVDVSGPNETVIAGKKVYVRKYGGLNPSQREEDYFDTESNSEIRLLRHLEGVGMTMVDRRYQDDPAPPLFAKLEYGAMKQVQLEVGTRFESTPTPAGGAVERHVWTVLAGAEMVPTPDGMKAAYKLEYRRQDQTAPAIHWVVPGYGLAQFDTFSGLRHSVCAARSCDAAGACTGPADCSACQ